LRENSFVTQFLRLHDLNDIRQAAAWLICSYPVGDQGAYLETLQRMTAANEPSFRTIAIEASNEDERGVAIAQLLAGRSALIWPLRVDKPRFCVDVLQSLLQELRDVGVLVAQTLSAPEQHEQKAVFLSAGFCDGGRLLYMAAERSRFLTELPVSDLEFAVVSPDDPALAAVVAASYAGSLDCPLVDGWRPINDVLAGYRATGTYRSGLWRLIQRRGENVGCLLLSDFSEQKHGELTYLGVDPQFRGQGIGQLAMQWLLNFAWKMEWQHIVLAVDAQNGPALRIYQTAGFQEIAQRQLVVFRVSQAACP
jgi:ribosomal protein S18 acetylase RimI-like enzyme